MKTKIYIYGLCDVFYDGYYIQGLREVYKNVEFNVSKFPKFNQGTFAFILNDNNQTTKVIIDSRDSNQINKAQLEWCDVYGKVNYNTDNLSSEDQKKIVAIGPSFGIKIWNLTKTFFYLVSNFVRFRKSIANKREFAANYWRQYKRLKLEEYNPIHSSVNEVFFISSIWKHEKETNRNRSLFIEACKSNTDLYFEGGFAPRKNGDNLGLDSLLYSKIVSLKVYMKKIKNSSVVFNTPAVLSCHGWKLGEFLALGKAIITTSHHNILPADLEANKHVIYVENEDEIKKSINRLIADIDFKTKLEFESRNYFNQYLSPTKVITRLIEKR